MTAAPTTAAVPTPATAGRLPSLTGLRWVAALLVFGFHAGTMRIIAEPDYQAVVDRLFSLGLSGVEFFFILSGFVLVWSYRDGDAPADLPAPPVRQDLPEPPGDVGGGAAGRRSGSPTRSLPGRRWRTSLCSRPGTPPPGYFYSVNTVSWSLSCELFFYLCLPLVLPVLRRAPPRRCCGRWWSRCRC